MAGWLARSLLAGRMSDTDTDTSRSTPAGVARVRVPADHDAARARLRRASLSEAAARCLGLVVRSHRRRIQGVRSQHGARTAARSHGSSVAVGVSARATARRRRRARGRRCPTARCLTNDTNDQRRLDRAIEPAAQVGRLYRHTRYHQSHCELVQQWHCWRLRDTHTPCSLTEPT